MSHFNYGFSVIFCLVKVDLPGLTASYWRKMRLFYVVFKQCDLTQNILNGVQRDTYLLKDQRSNVKLVKALLH